MRNLDNAPTKPMFLSPVSSATRGRATGLTAKFRSCQDGVVLTFLYPTMTEALRARKAMSAASNVFKVTTEKMFQAICASLPAPASEHTITRTHV